MLVETDNGDYQIVWAHQELYDCSLAWVHTKEEADAIGRPILMTEEHVHYSEGEITEEGHGRYWFKLLEGDEVYAHGEYVNPANRDQRVGKLVPYKFVDE